MAKPFSVMTGRRRIWYADFIRPPPPLFHVWCDAAATSLLFRASFALGRVFVTLGQRTLQRYLQLLDGWLREDCPVVAQQLIRMNHVATDQFHSVEIPRTENQITVSVIRNFDQQRSTVNFQFVERFTESLGLDFLEAEGVDHDQLAVGQLGGER